MNSHARTPAALVTPGSTGSRPMLQRQCACGTHTPSGGGECDDCARKRLQRKSASPDEEFQIPPIVDAVLAGSGRPLDALTRSTMERQFGHDFSGVRLHTDAIAARSAQAVHALAYTVGRDVVFGQGQYAPQSASGKRLLAHELAHVVQQRGASGSAGAIGRPDSALEHEADRAADRVSGGGSAPAMRAAPQARLARQAVPAESSSTETATVCRRPISLGDLSLPPMRMGNAPSGRYTISRVEPLGDNRKRVVLSTGRRYIVNRTPWTRTGSGPATRGGAHADADRDQVWVEFTFCRGANEGRIRVGANVPEQAIALLRNAIASGGDLDAAWRQASITPSVAGTFRFGTVDLRVTAQTTIGSGGDVQGVQGSAEVSGDIGSTRVTGGITGGSQDVGGNPLGGAQVGATLRIEWGAEPRRPPRCEEQWVRSGFNYDCMEERDVPPQQLPGRREVTRADARAYNLFFRYATANFDDPRNAQALAALRQDLAAGFQVTGIEGWTSPEGPMGPGTGGFEGNDALSGERAEAARRRVADELCPPEATCFAPGAQASGQGERMDPVDPATGERQDVRGAALESHVDSSFATDPGEDSVRSPALMERLRRTPSRQRRAELVYPWLRRAIVRLHRSRTAPEDCTIAIPATTETLGIGNCPDDIRRAAYPDTTP